MSDHQQSTIAVVQEYYRRIDANDTEWVLAQFAQNAVYERADATYCGPVEMRRFFCVQRRISGSHVVSHLWPVTSDIVITVGRFEGVGAEGDSRRVGFVDVWKFDSTGLIEHRQTFLALGHSYVES